MDSIRNDDTLASCKSWSAGYLLYRKPTVVTLNFAGDTSSVTLTVGNKDYKYILFPMILQKEAIQ